MAFSPTLEQQELIEDTMLRTSRPLPPRERISETALAFAFVAVAAAIWSIDPPHAFDGLTAGLCIAVMGFATRVKFDTGLGFTAATQLAFVPLVFALPSALVPVAVVVTLLFSSLPGVITGRTRPKQLLLTVGNAWFCLGPAAVFAVAHRSPQHAGPILLIAALLAQFAVDFAVSALRFWIDREVDLAIQLRESWVYLIDAVLSVTGLTVAVTLTHQELAALAPVPLLALLAFFARERRDRIESLLELNTAYRGTALVLGDFIEADDGYTGEHCRGVVALALSVGRRLGLSADRMRNLEFGALLHDIGKVAIPKEIINKPGRLDATEWEIIQTHTIEGQKMLDRIGGFMRNVGIIVRSHHERWDGSGYPDGDAGATIPLEARIISCCDTWNAMRTDRSYRKALSYEVAVAELRGSAGGQLDPRIVDVLLTIVADERPAPPDAEPSPAVSRLPVGESI